MMLHHLDLRPIYADRPSLQLRRSECRITLRKIISGTKSSRLDLKNDIIYVGIDDNLAVVENLVLQKIEKIALRPYTAKEVRERLFITNKERLRWTKDGRLPPAQYNIIRRGQKISVPTYSVTGIDELARVPAVIEGWRLENTK